MLDLCKENAKVRFFYLCDTVGGIGDNLKTELICSSR